MPKTSAEREPPDLSKLLVMKAHDVARLLLAGPDVTVVVATYDDQDHEQHVEVRTCKPLPDHYRWYDTNSHTRHDPAVALTASDD
jgi:hypothetical protein